MKEKLLKECLNKNRGYVTALNLQSCGIWSRDIKYFIENDILERIKPGLYRSNDFQPETEVDIGFLDLSIGVPEGVICLVSTLAYYELITYIPEVYCVAIPKNKKPPKLFISGYKIYYFTEEMYKAGIEIIKTVHCNIKIYSKEKSVCDIFRYRKKFGEDLALEALKNYLKLTDFNIHKLNQFMEICQTKTIMLPYLKAIMG